MLSEIYYQETYYQPRMDKAIREAETNKGKEKHNGKDTGNKTEGKRADCVQAV
jgi:hypothetical protein